MCKPAGPAGFLERNEAGFSAGRRCSCLYSLWEMPIFEAAETFPVLKHYSLLPRPGFATFLGNACGFFHDTCVRVIGMSMTWQDVGAGRGGGHAATVTLEADTTPLFDLSIEPN